jgi:hypothetical protein
VASAATARWRSQIWRPRIYTVLAVALLVPAPASGAASWSFAPAEAPPPPGGVASAPYSVPLGQVGEISFWEPNRGLLITGGTEGAGGPVAPGLYAYDGVTWHQLATVCGGAEGRIAWAGPDEFWTISDQRPGQIVSLGITPNLQSLSLCHFRDGEVVGSYAMPLEEPDSYLQMDAAACFGPSDCWFGGQDARAPTQGAFHLHWDGSAVTVEYEPEDHAVTNMVNFAGRLLESVQIGEGDAWLPSEEPKAPEKPKFPALIHEIAPAGSEPAFENLVIFSKRPLPEYGSGVQADALQGLDLATDGSPLGTGATQLWAAANPVPEGDLAHNAKAAALTVLRYASASEAGTGPLAWSQILPGPNGESSLPEGATLAGAAAGGEKGVEDAVAPEPGTADAWLSLDENPVTGALVALLNDHGALVEAPSSLGPAQGVGFRGVAGPIVCPAPADCWMATNAGADPVTDKQAQPGWLFHLSNGAAIAPDTDPFFDGEDPVIAYRPPDAGVPVVYPDLPPPDDSLANQQPPPPPAGPPEQVPAAPKSAHAKPLLEHIKSRFLHGRVLMVSFTLTARAHVQLIGRRKGQVVASTPTESLRAGAHRLSLTLDPRHWPTKLQFKAIPLEAPAAGVSAPAGAGATSPGAGPDTVGT